MIHSETKFAYRHKPTGKWVILDCVAIGIQIHMDLLDEFDPDILYSARNLIEEDLTRSNMYGVKYAAMNFLEFELVEIEVEYKSKI